MARLSTRRSKVTRQHNLLVNAAREPLCDMWPLAQQLGAEEFAGLSPREHAIAMAGLHAEIHQQSTTGGRVAKRIKKKIKRAAKATYKLAKSIATNPKLLKVIRAIKSVVKNKYFQMALAAIMAAIPGLQGAAAIMAAYIVAMQIIAYALKKAFEATQKAIKAGKKGKKLAQGIKKEAEEMKLSAEILKADAEGDQAAMLIATEKADAAGIDVEATLLKGSQGVTAEMERLQKQKAANWANVAQRSAIAIGATKTADQMLFTAGKLFSVRLANGVKPEPPKSMPKKFMTSWRRTPQQAYDAGRAAGRSIVAAQKRKAAAAKARGAAIAAKYRNVGKGYATAATFRAPTGSYTPKGRSYMPSGAKYTASAAANTAKYKPNYGGAYGAAMYRAAMAKRAAAPVVSKAAPLALVFIGARRLTMSRSGVQSIAAAAPQAPADQVVVQYKNKRFSFSRGEL